MGAAMKSNLTGLMSNHFHLMVLVNEVSLLCINRGLRLKRNPRLLVQSTQD